MQKVRRPESSAALLLMRAALAHPLHCSTESLAPALTCPDCQPPLARITAKGGEVFVSQGAGGCGGWLEGRSRQGGAGGAELVEDGSQRVHGARTDPLSLSGTHVSLG